MQKINYTVNNIKAFFSRWECQNISIVFSQTFYGKYDFMKQLIFSGAVFSDRKGDCFSFVVVEIM